MRVVCVMMAGLSAGCAGLDTRLPDIDMPSLSAETARQQVIAYEELDRLVTRLGRVGDRVRTANAGLCPKTRPSLGLFIHALEDYPKYMRETVADTGAREEPTVRAVLDGSPAFEAGIAEGEAILVDGKAVKVASRAFERAVESGRITVRGVDGTVREVAVSPRPSCDYALKVSVSSAINAFATGRSVTVTSGMMNFVESDDELALIIGHELAHNTMGHIRKIVGNYILSLGGTRYTRPFESEADYVGLYYLARAGYDMDDVEDFWRRLATVSPRATTRAKSHPTSSERFLRIAAAREEILAKEAAGEALVPNLKDGS